MKDKIKRFIEIILILHIIIVISVSIYYSEFHDPLTYGQVISKNHYPEHLEESKSILLKTVKSILIPDIYVVVIEGYTAKRVLKQKIIYLNSNQYHYTFIGDYVDIGGAR